MKRLVLISSAIAALAGVGLATIIGKIALAQNPQDEFYACIKTVIGAPVECHYTGQWFSLLVIVFVVGFVPTLAELYDRPSFEA
ncbi:hypothetical protein [Jiella avicenniae]|uniref:Uncharacterized protein n=1 Tax=Jiella avicenniae TaxID=2907202 RepID=A0A9X1P762_9HYPH|nr:hypothetical protein [Jiella avicenniae]MCE7030396.1 hypothetical protein [Jiella avicenniae]